MMAVGNVLVLSYFSPWEAKKGYKTKRMIKIIIIRYDFDKSVYFSFMFE